MENDPNGSGPSCRATISENLVDDSVCGILAQVTYLKCIDITVVVHNAIGHVVRRCVVFPWPPIDWVKERAFVLEVFLE